MSPGKARARRKSGGRGRVGCRRLALQPRCHHSQQRKRTRTQPRTDQLKESQESKVDATSGEQERWSKPLAVCPGQSRAKEKGKKVKD